MFCSKRLVFFEISSITVDASSSVKLRCYKYKTPLKLCQHILQKCFYFVFKSFCDYKNPE